MPPTVLHALVAASPGSTCSRVLPPEDLQRGEGRVRKMTWGRERGRWRELYLPCRRRLPLDLVAIHRICPSSSGFGCPLPYSIGSSPQDDGHRRSEPVGRASLAAATRRLGTWLHATEEGPPATTRARVGQARREAWPGEESETESRGRQSTWRGSGDCAERVERERRQRLCFGSCERKGEVEGIMSPRESRA
jgi:hypothetical protein